MKRLLRAGALALALAIGLLLWGLIVGPIGTTGLLLALLLGGLAMAAMLFWPTPPVRLDKADPAALPATARLWLARHKALPAPAQLAAIDRHLLTLDSQLAALPASHEASGEVTQELERLLKRHLPELVERYTRVPAPQRTPELTQALVSGLSVVAAELGRASEKLSEADRDAVHIKGRFLESRYGPPGA
jgi:hypothetical protein